MMKRNFKFVAKGPATELLALSPNVESGMLMLE